MSKGRINLFEVEMEESAMSPLRKRKTINNRPNKIWKDKSLFEQLATAN
jgi:hypothetical protein